MRIAFVFSDLSYPPKEGLHQQTILTLRQLLSSKSHVDVYGFVKNSSHFDVEGLQTDEGIVLAEPPIFYDGSSLGEAFRCVFFRSEAARLRRGLRNGNYDLVHYEGVTASSLRRRRDRQAAIVSMIDPGSRRNLRFALQSSSFGDRVRFLTAAAAFVFLELKVRGKRTIWHVVSEPDAVYLRRLYRRGGVWSIPVTIPQELIARPPQLDRGEKAVATNTSLLIYADLRQAHMRGALERICANVLQPSPNRESLNITVLGRTKGDTEMLQWFRGLSVTFVDWAEDYVKEIMTHDVVLLPDEVGTGLKNRAVQVMALGKAVIGGPVAFEGIPIQHGVHAYVGRDYDDIRAGLDTLCGSRRSRERLGAAGASLIHSMFSPEAVKKRWRNCYAMALGLTPTHPELTPQA